MCGTQPPSAKLDFRRNRIWTSPHIWGAHCLHIYQISWKYLDWGKDMRRKRNSKRAIWRCNSTSGFKFDKCRRPYLETFLCMILQNFKKTAQRAAELHAILLFLYLSLNLHSNGTTTQCHHAGHLYKCQCYKGSEPLIYTLLSLSYSITGRFTAAIFISFSVVYFSFSMHRQWRESRANTKVCGL